MSQVLDRTVEFAGYRCRVYKGRYADGGGVALWLVDAADGEPVAHATVNVPELNLGADEVVIKDYSENAGMLEALVEAGIVAGTGRCVRLGFVLAPVCRLLV